jgi:Zn-dependent protease with chaperone function
VANTSAPRFLHSGLSHSVVPALCVGLLLWGHPAAAQLLGALSEQEEIEVGRQATAEIEKDLTLLTDEFVTSYVSELGRALASQSERSSLDYTFKVVDSAEINAFALPGGFIYLNRGLLEAADNEAEVAGVLGHEIGHVVARHGAEQVQRASYANLGLSVLGSILGRGTRGQIANIAAEMTASGVFMKFGRDAEREADRLGAANVAAAGLDPNGMLTFFEKLGALREGQANVVERFFASHPQPAERVENIQDLVETLRRTGDFSSTSRRFDEVKARLEDLPRPPGPTADAATGSDPDAVAVRDVESNPPRQAHVEIVTYDGATLDHQIAARFAPVFRQALGSSPRFDYVTRFDFDGDWRGDNNWENAGNESHRLSATIYFNVSETETHYFVHYAAFHPRDYKGGNVRGAVLSEILREGVARHGNYDPTGLSQAAVLAHENDLEGALVVVQKAIGLFGSTQVVFVETLAHNQFLQYRVGSGERDVTAEDEHAVIFIEPKGHGIEAYHGGDQLRSAEGGFVTYRYTGQAEEPTGAPDEEVGYDLVSLTESLWPAARQQHSGVFGGSFDYQDWTVRALDAGGNVVTHETTLGLVGSVLNGVVGGRNMARPPWGWYDQDETDQRQGGWYLTPAETVKRHFGLGDDFSTTYTHHPTLGVYRAAQ